MRCFIFNNMNITFVLTRYLRKFKHCRTKLSIKSVHSTDDFFGPRKFVSRIFFLGLRNSMYVFSSDFLRFF